jgi:transcriptional regulator with XRE-family HTH domain
MNAVSTPSSQKSWQTRRQRVSVLAELALRKDNVIQRLIALRDQHGLTQEQAAQRVGVTSRQWQRWESGESMPYPRNLDQIASKFGITVAEFFDKDGDHRSPVVVNRLDGDLEARIATIEDTLAGITRLLREARSEQDRISALLERQTRVLERIEQATAHANDAADRLDDAVERAATGLRSAPRAKRPAAPRTARKHSPRASKPGPA